MFEDIIFCPVCDGEAAVLGTLGSRTHARCTCCGMEFSHVTANDLPAVDEPLPEVEPAYDFPLVWTEAGMQYAFGSESAPVQASLF
jgi:hypothetical protein